MRHPDYYNKSGCADPTAFEAIRNLQRDGTHGIVIKHLKFDTPRRPWDVRVDRHTIWGNPFRMSGEAQRDEVCDRYERYFYDRLLHDTSFKYYFSELQNLYLTHGKLNLFCWCAPKRCHAETIIDALTCECHIAGRSEKKR